MGKQGVVDTSVHSFLKEIKKKQKKRKRETTRRREDDTIAVVDDDNEKKSNTTVPTNGTSEKKAPLLKQHEDRTNKQRKKEIKRETTSKQLSSSNSNNDLLVVSPLVTATTTSLSSSATTTTATATATIPILPPHQYILAPMVGASELAFRLLCRKYGAQLAYTPMMNAHAFAHCAKYRQTEFQTCANDRPLVCHFSANDPNDFAKAAVAAAPYCDAIDLNLGCPQRTAFVGHFGSYLLQTKQDRDLVCAMIQHAVRATNKPIFTKIRLLSTIDETIQLCQQLRDAGASLIAVHARQLASWERTGPGARDGAALLDQVAILKQHVPDVVIIANGNVITYKDVQDNLQLTNADGIMSAEGILDNPALFLPRLGSPVVNEEQTNEDAENDIKAVGEKEDAIATTTTTTTRRDKKKRKLLKKLRSIQKIEQKVANNKNKKNSSSHEVMMILDERQKEKLANKDSVLALLEQIQKEESAQSSNTTSTTCTSTSLSALYQTASDKVELAREYLGFVKQYPTAMRTVLFHIRRMLKSELERYQLLQDCMECTSVDAVIIGVLDKIATYRKDAHAFIYDQTKAAADREAQERRQRQEGRRKAFEERMMRKAKREGKDKMHYLEIGAAVPTADTLQQLKATSREQALALWKRNHSQHCMSFHLDAQGCQRGRACAFLHVDVNRFEEQDEVAG